MPEVVVTGYASLDYPVVLSGIIAPDRTTPIRFRDPASWPRLGGSPAYVGAALAKAGCCVRPVTWVGQDEAGDAYCRLSREAGLAPQGIARLKGGHSPVSVMVHQPDGSSMCLYDPGFAGKERLGKHQREMIAAANHLCVTVGPGHLMEEILELCPRHAQLYWIVKNDPACFSPAVCADLAGRADVIFCNRSERRLIDGLFHDGTIVVETMGREGHQVTRDGTSCFVPTKAVDVADPTGAGDIFAGTFIASFLKTEDPHKAARVASEATRRALEARRNRERKAP